MDSPTEGIYTRLARTSHLLNKSDSITENINLLLEKAKLADEKRKQSVAPGSVDRQISELSIPQGPYESDDQEQFQKTKKYSKLIDRAQRALDNPEFAAYTKKVIKDFEKYADKIEKISYVRCKESLLGKCLLHKLDGIKVM